jgi:glycosyltransferase involved in cell wall biosynthesis
VKPKIHFYSDCPFFAGCENMLVNFFNDDRLREDFELSFSYRYSSEYERGLHARVQNGVEAIPLRLLDLEAQLRRIHFRPLRIIARLIGDALMLKFFYVWQNRRKLQKFFRGRKIDLLHINNGGYPGALSCLSAVIAARNTGIENIIFVVNNVASRYTDYGRWFDRLLDRRVARRVSKFITGSAHARDRLTNVLRLSDGQALNIHNGIQPRALTQTREQVRARLGLNADGPVFGIVALQVRRKGHMILLQALDDIRRQHGRSAVPQLAVEGEGPLRNSLEAFVREHELGDKVLFIGREENVFNLLNAIDVFVLPSLSHEDFPNVTLEAMSLGKPVIASRVSGIPEQIEDGKTGLIVEPGDSFGLADAVHRLGVDAGLRQRMGEASQRRFQAMFSAGIAVQKYRNLYSGLLQTRSA